MRRTTPYRQGAQSEAITVAIRLTCCLLNEVARSYTHNLCEICLVMLTFLLDIVLVGFPEITDQITSMTCKVMEAYEGEHLSHILVSKFEHKTNQDGMSLIKVSFSQGTGWFQASKVKWNTTVRDNRMEYVKPFVPPKFTAICSILDHTPIYSISHVTFSVVSHNLLLKTACWLKDLHQTQWIWLYRVAY